MLALLVRMGKHTKCSHLIAPQSSPHMTLQNLIAATTSVCIQCPSKYGMYICLRLCIYLWSRGLVQKQTNNNNNQTKQNKTKKKTPIDTKCGNNKHSYDTQKLTPLHMPPTPRLHKDVGPCISFIGVVWVSMNWLHYRSFVNPCSCYFTSAIKIIPTNVPRKYTIILLIYTNLVSSVGDTHVNHMVKDINLNITKSSLISSITWVQDYAIASPSNVLVNVNRFSIFLPLWECIVKCLIFLANNSAWSLQDQLFGTIATWKTCWKVMKIDGIHK